MGEFTYNNVESDFSSWNLTRGSVSLLEDRLFLVLPASKTDPFRRGVTLTIPAATDEACAVKSLRNLFERFPKAYYQPLFPTRAGTFSRNYVTRQLQKGVCTLGYEGNYTGHSFRRGAATSARLAGLSEEEIQLLGRWRSNSYRLYIELIPTGYTMHLADTSSRRGRNLYPLPLHPQIRQPPPQSPLEPAPGIRSHDQVDVSR